MLESTREDRDHETLTAVPVDLYADATYPSLALRAAGLPAISFLDNQMLKLALCQDSDCAEVTIIDLDVNVLPTGASLPLLLIEGLRAIIYQKGEPPRLMMTRYSASATFSSAIHAGAYSLSMAIIPLITLAMLPFASTISMVSPRPRRKSITDWYLARFSAN